jgi:hypothetical protein
VLNPDRVSVRGFCGYDETVNIAEDDGGNTEEGSKNKGGIGESHSGVIWGVVSAW